MTLERLKTIRKMAYELGLRLHFLLMVGLPNETKKSLYRTYRLLSNLKPETIGVGVVTPYPGTPLYNEAKEKGWIETEDWTKFEGRTLVMHTNNFSLQNLKKARQILRQGFSLLRRNPLNWIRSRLLDHHFKRWVSF